MSVTSTGRLAEPEIIFLPVDSEQLTVAQLIEKVVREQVTTINQGLKTSVVKSKSDSELLQMLNRPADESSSGEQQLLADKEVEKALEAFGERVFVVMAGGEQLDSLSAPVNPQTITEVQFLRLTPLVGG